MAAIISPSAHVLGTSSACPFAARINAVLPLPWRLQPIRMTKEPSKVTCALLPYKCTYNINTGNAGIYTADSCVRVLSLEEVRRTVSKLLVFGFRGKSLDAHARQLISMGAGGVILFSRNFESPEQVAKLCKELKKEAKSRLIIMVDQEGGIISRLGPPFTLMPMAQVIGDTKDPASAACVGKIIGRELRAVNIDMNLAPVLDVNTNPMNSVIKGRSFGRLPNLVADFGCAFIESLQKEGVAACAKHYPGHGDTIKDSHFGLPFLGHTLKRLEKVELFPFSKAVRANVAAVMVGHICVPALDVSNSLSKSQAWPATMSEGAISYLRKRLLFEGVVISDCMEMGAITKNYSIGDACVKAVLAGVDMVLISHTKKHQIAAISSLVNAVMDGRLPFERIKEAECRINNLMNIYVSDASDVSKSKLTIRVVGCKEHADALSSIICFKKLE